EVQQARRVEEARVARGVEAVRGEGVLALEADHAAVLLRTHGRRRHCAWSRPPGASPPGAPSCYVTAWTRGSVLTRVGRERAGVGRRRPALSDGGRDPVGEQDVEERSGARWRKPASGSGRQPGWTSCPRSRVRRLLGSSTG